MTYGDSELQWEALGELELDLEEFGDPFGGLDSEGPSLFNGNGAIARLDSETAQLMMDVAAELAAEADSEEEADAFLPIIAKLAPMALKALAPMAKTAFAKIAPKMSQGVFSAGRKMLQRFGQKGIEALPDITRGVARDTVQAVADGRDVSGDMVLRSAAQHTLPFLQDPRQAQQAAHRRRLRMSQAQRVRRPQPQPHYRQQPQGYGQTPYGGDPSGQSAYGPAPYGPAPYAPSPYGQQGYPPNGEPAEWPLPEPNYGEWGG